MWRSAQKIGKGARQCKLRHKYRIGRKIDVYLDTDRSKRYISNRYHPIQLQLAQCVPQQPLIPPPVSNRTHKRKASFVTSGLRIAYHAFSKIDFYGGGLSAVRSRTFLSSVGTHCTRVCLILKFLFFILIACSIADTGSSPFPFHSNSSPTIPSPSTSLIPFGSQLIAPISFLTFHTVLLTPLGLSVIQFRDRYCAISAYSDIRRRAPFLFHPIVSTIHQTVRFRAAHTPYVGSPATGGISLRHFPRR